MAIALYMDQHVPRAITAELRSRGIDVLTAYEDGTSELQDPALLDRANTLQRVLFSRDEDLLAEAARRQRIDEEFSGVVYAHQLRVTIGTCISDLEIIAKVGTFDDLRNGVIFLPL